MQLNINLFYSLIVISLIKNSSQFCVNCLDGTNNLCSRVTNQMLKDNKDFKMKLCGDIEDGQWTGWADWGECEEFEMVGEMNYTCGNGVILQRRNCSRTLGGQNCLNSEGFEVPDPFQVRSFPCSGRRCPGKLDTHVLTTKINSNI